MADKQIICPLLKQECIQDGGLIDKKLCGCPFWIHVIGKHPQTGQELDQVGCAIAWIPVLLIENSKEQRTTAHEVERLRNETIPKTDATNGLLAHLFDAVKNPTAIRPVLHDALSLGANDELQSAPDTRRLER